MSGGKSRVTTLRWSVRSSSRVEAGAGDPEAADARLAFLAGLTLLEITEEALTLAQRLLQAKAIPKTFQKMRYTLQLQW